MMRNKYEHFISSKVTCKTLIQPMARDGRVKVGAASRHIVMQLIRVTPRLKVLHAAEVI